MIKCPGCGEENPPKFRLCGYCGAPLAAAAAAALPVHEVRKTVTLIFSDLKDSTALGERLDSEALHEVKERYFAAMAAEITRHGGKIEKYIGDAIMAVFGLPRAHEDDALRAVRAAVGMRDGAEANVNETSRRATASRSPTAPASTPARSWRYDDPTADQKLATGDAVNVTARLEQAAPANEIYIGEVTLPARARRGRGRGGRAADAEGQVASRARVPADRGARAWTATCGGSRHARRRPRRGTRGAAGSVRRRGRRRARAHLVTVIGDAGVGKSRLVREADRPDRGQARASLRGRCLALRRRHHLLAAARDDRRDAANIDRRRHAGDRLRQAAGVRR